MKSLLFTIAILTFFSSCGKHYTPATTADLENLSKKSESQQSCFNESMILTFGSETNNETSANGYVTTKRIKRVKIKSLKEFRRNSLSEKIQSFNFGMGWDYENKKDTKLTIDSLSPTVQKEVYAYAHKTKNASFVAAMCDDAKTAMLENLILEKRDKNSANSSYSEFDGDTMYEVWSCYGSCN